MTPWPALAEVGGSGNSPLSGPCNATSGVFTVPRLQQAGDSLEQGY